jgi:hypothetical protein
VLQGDELTDSQSRFLDAYSAALPGLQPRLALKTAAAAAALTYTKAWRWLRLEAVQRALAERRARGFGIDPQPAEPPYSELDRTPHRDRSVNDVSVGGALASVKRLPATGLPIPGGEHG